MLGLLNKFRGYGSSQPNRSLRGLFDGKNIGSGNQVSFSERKSRRKWLPNVQPKIYFSNLFNESLKIKVTASAIRSIDKAGGIDYYLLNSKLDRLGTGLGWDLRTRLRRVIEAREEDQRYRAQTKG
eukprot:Sdes_comp23094_c0_seq1m21416